MQEEIEDAVESAQEEGILSVESLASAMDLLATLVAEAMDDLTTKAAKKGAEHARKRAAIATLEDEGQDRQS